MRRGGPAGSAGACLRQNHIEDVGVHDTPNLQKTSRVYSNCVMIQKTL